MLNLLSVELVGALALAPFWVQDDPQSAAANVVPPAQTIRLGEPRRLKTADAPILTESPGYASPAWYDVNGDGRGDLIVGQFKDGKLQVFHGTEHGFAEGVWLEASGDVARVPGVS